jgi:deoxycytidylate deaminase
LILCLWKRITLRPEKDQTFMRMARELAAQSTCPRALKLGGVGAILLELDSRRPLGFGYCGSKPGEPHCTDPDVGCLIGPEGGCVRTVHAEVNAFDWMRPSDKRKVLYTTLSPCLGCLARAALEDTALIIYEQQYRIFDPVRIEADRLGIELRQLSF